MLKLHAEHATHKRPPHTRAGSGHGDGHRRLKQLLLVLCAAQLMVILDITAVNVALPDLAQGLGINGGDIGWTITSYSLIFGSLLFLGGRAADLVGQRRMFMTGLAVFMVASIAAATAGGAGTLFAARAVQGLGAAMLSPAALSILMSTFREGHQRAHALAAWGAVGGAGAAIGVLLGGALTELVGWQAIFLINVPVGLGLAVAARRLIAPDATGPRWSGFDLRGAALATTSLGAIAFVIVELRATHPLLRIDRLADRGVGGGFLTMLAAAAVLFGLFLLSSLYLQNVLGAGPLETGLSFLPLAIALAAGVHAGSHVMMHAGVRVPMAAGFAATAAGMLLLSGVDAHGLGLVLVSVSVSVMTGAKDEETGMLSGLNTTGHEIGGSIGIAIVATIAAGSAGLNVPGLVAHGIGDAFLALSGLAVLSSLAALV